MILDTLDADLFGADIIPAKVVGQDRTLDCHHMPMELLRETCQVWSCQLLLPLLLTLPNALGQLPHRRGLQAISHRRNLHGGASSIERIGMTPCPLRGGFPCVNPTTHNSRHTPLSLCLLWPSQ